MKLPVICDLASATAGLAALLTAVAVPTGAAFAEEAPVPLAGQAEWAQRYDAGVRLAVEHETIPTLSPETIQGTAAAIDRYRDIVAKGGWGTVSAAVGLHLGSTGSAVTALRERLAITGDLDSAAGAFPVFDTYVESAVKHFQARHGLSPNGLVTSETVTALNIPAEDRLKQLQLNLVRLKSFSGNLGQRFVMANIPAAEVETVEDGRVVGHHAAGVGKADRQSPTLQTKAIEVNFNPYWHVPASIIRKDLIPKMQADPNYLTDNHIHIYDANDKEVSSSIINWNSMDAIKYKFREDPGIGNSMGVVRINISNPFGVYMHDTATKGIFGDDFRFISSGCIRVQNVRDYITWLLKDTPGWDREHVDQAIRSGARIDAKIQVPVPVYWVYITSWATPDGVVEFRDDIYAKDGLGIKNVLSRNEVPNSIAENLDHE